MNRLLQNDFERLITYFNEYDLKEIASKEAFKRNSKIIHRKLYAFLVLTNELEEQGILSDENNIFKMYFKEIGSDLILSFFCWVNGAYKPAELQLRSSIENFTKAFVYSELPQILQIKSVYEIFDSASSSNVFCNKICSKHFKGLRNEYTFLCAFVHGHIDTLTQNDALIKLPEYNDFSANEFCKHFQNILNQMLSIGYFTFFYNVFRMHVTNRELFLQGLTKKDKSEIYDFKTNTDK